MNIEETNFNSIFAKNLRNYLEANHMTQLELSKLLNVGTTSVYNWCNGVKAPRMDKIDRMCQIFGCKRSDLITDAPIKTKTYSDNENELISLFENADPDVQNAVMILLKSAQHDS